MRPSMQNEYDKSGIMPFGKHIGTKFEDVPDNYLRYILNDFVWKDIERKWPNFYAFLMENYSRLQDESNF